MVDFRARSRRAVLRSSEPSLLVIQVFQCTGFGSLSIVPLKPVPAITTGIVSALGSVDCAMGGYSGERDAVFCLPEQDLFGQCRILLLCVARMGIRIVASITW